MSYDGACGRFTDDACSHLTCIDYVISQVASLGIGLLLCKYYCYLFSKYTGLHALLVL